MQRTSGFFAVDMDEAKAFARRWVLNGDIIFTPGVHKHTPTSSCGLGEVSEAKFNSVRSRSDSIVWRDYHLIIQNCQHWADYVWKGA